MTKKQRDNLDIITQIKYRLYVYIMFLLTSQNTDTLLAVAVSVIFVTSCCIFFFFTHKKGHVYKNVIICS